MLLKETCYRHNSRIFGRKRRESPFETDPGGWGGGGGEQEGFSLSLSLPIAITIFRG